MIKGVHDPERYPWAFRVKDVRFFLDRPIVVDLVLRRGLDAFKESDPEAAWGWFVQATRRITVHDFGLLTGQSQPTT